MRLFKIDAVVHMFSFDAIVVSARSSRKILEILSHQAGSIVLADPHTLERFR